MSAPSPSFGLWCENFAPGFIDTPQPDALPLGGTPDARNAWFSSVDALGVTGQRQAIAGKRPGMRLVNPAAIASGKPVDIFEFRRATLGPQLLAVCDGGLSAFDGFDAFTAIASGWTSGNVARCVVSRGNAYVYDGTYMRRYDGTSVLEVGSAAPSSISAMTGTGTGVTGTYVAVYTWYDAATEHHSSVSAETPALALANQSRVHTKPGSAAPAWATHWGAWVKRTDTSELNFYFVANVAIATGTLTESTSDTARNTPADRPSENDAPPGAWALLEEWRGWGIGVLQDADDFYISRRGDLQSWHPRNKFGVSKGDGEALTCVKKFGTNLLLMKPHSTHRLIGDRVPFEIDSVHSAYGSVSQESAVEVDGKLYGWDRVRGPYVTDLVSWRPLGDGRIANLLATVNRSALSKIRAVHDEAHNLIIWCVPTQGSTRVRTLLAYHYLLEAWLPPTTGHEYRSLAAFTTSAGVLGTYFGDEWGRVYEMFQGTHDGPPSGTMQDVVTGSSASTVTASAAAFYTTGAGLAGMPVGVKSASAGTWQWRTIASNTGTVITLDTVNGSPWSTNPAAGDTVIVGGIDWYQWTPWLDFSRPDAKKKLEYLYVGAQSPVSGVNLDVLFRFNNEDGVSGTDTFTFPTGAGSGVWGESLWGVGLWGGQSLSMRSSRVPRSVYTAQIRFSNPYPNNEITIAQWGLTSDELPRRKSPGPNA
ncbi:MAG: hypothetical protein IT181_13195 [Acidobacteria bacterium]|nr:hypothetical protein [Acidobacteriota bacterium]